MMPRIQQQKKYIEKSWFLKRRLQMFYLLWYYGHIFISNDPRIFSSIFFIHAEIDRYHLRYALNSCKCLVSSRMPPNLLPTHSQRDRTNDTYNSSTRSRLGRSAVRPSAVAESSASDSITWTKEYTIND